MKKILVLMLGVVSFSVGFLCGAGYMTSTPLLRILSAPSYIRAQLASCEKIDTHVIFEDSQRQRCYNRTLAKSVRALGVLPTVSAFRTYLKTPNGKYLQGMRCHSMAHEIGNAAAGMGIPSDTLLTQCIDMCGFGSSDVIDGIDFGCTNGAGHTWVLTSRTIEEAFAKCAAPKVPEAIRNGCFHGIGHGLRERFGNDIEQAIVTCLLLSTDEARYQCAHAIFMDQQPQTDLSQIPANIVKYCHSLPGKVADSCFEFSGLMEYTRGGNVQGALSVCGSGPINGQSNCRVRVGGAVFETHRTVESVAQCLVVAEHERKDCLSGFIRNTVDNINDQYGSIALYSCGLLPEGEKGDCYGLLGELILLRFGESMRTTTCSHIKDRDYLDRCLAPV